jgi:RNA polymerase sigma factor (sigma-70 family)
MAENALDGLLQHFRKTAAVHASRKLSDRELLERFAGVRDEAAFTVLLERFGPMVLGICRRALPSFHDAEDACQATFLVLACNARSVRKKASLSSWLHGVACRVAARLKRDQARRRIREQRQNLQVQIDPAAEVSWREVQVILDEELERLPERYRALIILCYLECRTRDEAANQLGLPPSTVHGRLERARDLLRARLAERGLTLGAVVFAAFLAESSSQAGLSAAFIRSSIEAAKLFASNQVLAKNAAGAQVIALAQEVLTGMFITNLKLGSVAVLCATMIGTVIVGSLSSISTAQEVMPETVQMDPNVNHQDASRNVQEMKSEKWSGTLALKSVDLVNETLVARPLEIEPDRTRYSFRSGSWQLVVKPTTRITIDGREAKLVDLQSVLPLHEGDGDAEPDGPRVILVDAELETAKKDPKENKRNGVALRIDATGRPESGVAQAINTGKNTLTLKRIARVSRVYGGEVIYPEFVQEMVLAKNVRVTINDRGALLSDLQPNMKVTLQMSAVVKELVVGINAYGPTVKGVLHAVDPATSTVSVTIPSIQLTTEDVQVAKYAKVVVDGKEAKLADLKVGMPVTLRMCCEPEQSIIIAITNEKAK